MAQKYNGQNYQQAEGVFRELGLIFEDTSHHITDYGSGHPLDPYELSCRLSEYASTKDINTI